MSLVGARAVYRARRTLHTGADLLTNNQQQRLQTRFTFADPLGVEAPWGISSMIAAYRDTDPSRARTTMTAVIASLSTDIPAALTEAAPARTNPQPAFRRHLAYFDRPGSSNGQPGHERTARTPLRLRLGFCNLTHHIARSAGSWQIQIQTPDYTWIM